MDHWPKLDEGQYRSDSFRSLYLSAFKNGCIFLACQRSDAFQTIIDVKPFRLKNRPSWYPGDCKADGIPKVYTRSIHIDHWVTFFRKVDDFQICENLYSKYILDFYQNRRIEI
jgi:hypothetical protein